MLMCQWHHPDMQMTNTLDLIQNKLHFLPTTVVLFLHRHHHLRRRYHVCKNVMFAYFVWLEFVQFPFQIDLRNSLMCLKWFNNEFRTYRRSHSSAHQTQQKHHFTYHLKYIYTLSISWNCCALIMLCCCRALFFALS